MSNWKKWDEYYWCNELNGLILKLKDDGGSLRVQLHSPGIFWQDEDQYLLDQGFETEAEARAFIAEFVGEKNTRTAPESIGGRAGYEQALNDTNGDNKGN